MNLAHDHEWNVSTGEAKAIQKRLSPEVAVQPLSETYDRPVETVAGVDVSVKGDVAKAAVSVLHLDDLGVIEEVTHRCETPFPYVPGLLSFREMPAVLPALQKLGALPDVLITDSQGYAHPRRFGLACHLGVVLDHPAFGVAKSLLTGSPSTDAVRRESGLRERRPPHHAGRGGRPHAPLLPHLQTPRNHPSRPPPQPDRRGIEGRGLGGEGRERH